MTDVATVPVTKALKKNTAAKPKVPAAHPKYVDMIKAAVASLKERGGSSRQAVLKYVMANYKVGTDKTMINSRVKTALKSAVKAGLLKQSKGTGATGSFKLDDTKTDKPKKTAAKKSPAKKTATAKKPKTKKVAAKKPATPKKAKSAKISAKPKKAKSPKKVKTPTKVKTAKPKKPAPKKKAVAKSKKA